MKIKIKRLSKDTMSAILSAVYGAITACILVFALLATHALSAISNQIELFFSLTFFSLMLSRIFLAINYFLTEKENRHRITFIKNICFATMFLVGAILCFTNIDFIVFTILLFIIYLGAIGANRICLIFERKSVFNTIVNAILVGLDVAVIVIAISWSADPQTSVILLVGLLLVIIIFSFLEVLAFAFSRIQLKGLIKIIRKTYVLEILYGLIILLVSFSFYFTIMEDSIETFGDGLWYSFAVITTIGFGDLTVTTPMSRVLTVILGLYGIIVTASITSVIVNYYNEVKDKKDTSQRNNIEKDIIQEVEESIKSITKKEEEKKED